MGQVIWRLLLTRGGLKKLLSEVRAIVVPSLITPGISVKIGFEMKSDQSEELSPLLRS